MNAARIELALILGHVGVSTELSTFSNRLQLQKKTYLVQITGPDLGYRFGWYIRGPYSPGLTQDAFTLKDEIASGDTEHESFHLSSEVVDSLETAKQLWALPGHAVIDHDDWIELLASFHYLRHIAYRPHGATRDFEEVFVLLRQSKPRFASQKKAARQAWQRLDEFGLIESKTLN